MQHREDVREQGKFEDVRIKEVVGSPQLSQEELAVIGSVVVELSQLDVEVEGLCWLTLFRNSDDASRRARGMLVTRPLTAKGRLQLLRQSLLLHKGDGWTEREKFLALTRRTEDLFAERNFAAHATWMQFVTYDPFEIKSGVETFGQMYGKGVRHDMHATAPTTRPLDELKEVAKRTRTLRLEVADFVSREL
jgi:hypothetical protein